MRKRPKTEAKLQSKNGVVKRNGVCISCSLKPTDENTSFCVLCNTKYHRDCATPQLRSFAIVCAVGVPVNDTDTLLLKI